MDASNAAADALHDTGDAAAGVAAGPGAHAASGAGAGALAGAGAETGAKTSAQTGAQTGAGEGLALAPRLRERRRSSGLTLEGAARRLELSPAHLSRLESGLRQPSLPVLLGLARLYGTTVSDLLGETASEPEPIVRGDRMAAVPAGGWTYWRAGGTGRAMQALRVHVPAGIQRALVRVHPGEEWLYVTGGELDLSLGDRTHRLAPGDSAHFDSLVPHRLAAGGPGGVDLLFVHTLMQSETSALCVGAPDSARDRDPRDPRDLSTRGPREPREPQERGGRR